MEKEMIQYYEKIGLIGPLLEKVETAYKFYNQYLGIKILDTFVSEFIDKEGARIYQNLWFFSDELCLEAKSFMISEDYDSQIIKDKVSYIQVTKKEFDIVNGVTTDSSRMTLEFGMPDDRIGDMKASKENCLQLSLILKKYIQQNQKI